MKPRMRVVFDTNIYISAIVFGGNPRQCLELARSGEFQLFTSKAIILELATKLKEKFRWQDNEIREVVEGLSKFITVVTPKKRVNIIRAEPQDNQILECALAAKVDFIVSGDKKHLLSLREFNSISIISAKQFLDFLYKKS